MCISAGLLEQAEDTEKDAKADLVAADEQLNTLGVWLASGLIRQMLGRNT